MANVRLVSAYKSGKNNTTKYRVLYNTKEMFFTNENLPKTIKKFMQTHPFERISDTKVIFK